MLGSSVSGHKTDVFSLSTSLACRNPAVTFIVSEDSEGDDIINMHCRASASANQLACNVSVEDEPVVPCLLFWVILVVHEPELLGMPLILDLNAAVEPFEALSGEVHAP
jgi:hypothetical protein